MGFARVGSNPTVVEDVCLLFLVVCTTRSLSASETVRPQNRTERALFSGHRRYVPYNWLLSYYDIDDGCHITYIFFKGQV